MRSKGKLCLPVQYHTKIGIMKIFILRNVSTRCYDRNSTYPNSKWAFPHTTICSVRTRHSGIMYINCTHKLIFCSQRRWCETRGMCVSLSHKVRANIQCTNFLLTTVDLHGHVFAVVVSALKWRRTFAIIPVTCEWHVCMWGMWGSPDGNTKTSNSARAQNMWSAHLLRSC